MTNIAYNDAYMGHGDPLKGSAVPGFGAANRKPDTSRVERRKQRGERNIKPVVKGLSRAAVSVKRLDPKTYEVRVKGSEQIVGYVRKVMGKGGAAYAYKLDREERAHSGFASQKAAVDRMLTKV